MNTIPENTIESIKNLDNETIQAVNNYYLNVGQFKPKQEKKDETEETKNYFVGDGTII